MDKVVASQTAAFLPEKLEFFAKAIKGQTAYDVFLAVSKGHLRKKFVSDIQAETGLSNVRVSQVASKLASLGMIDQGRDRNPKTGKTENYYAKRRDIDVIKERFVRMRNNPASAAKVATIRRPSLQNVGNTTFLKKPPTPKRRSRKAPRTREAAALRIAFLGTNPIADNPLRTDIEARTLARALKATKNGQRIAVNYYPAAEWSDLLDALNEFAPHVVHFSGHGGGGAVVFDNEGVYDDGGVEIDYDLLSRFLGATTRNPEILVLNACDTVDGAKILLANVGAVVAMSDSIDDAAAAYFAKFMYTALAQGQPLSMAVEQGKIALAAMKLRDEKLPTILTRPNADLSRFKYF